ncbi:hypothetical protein [uncultured Reyranella sp.]|uniref:hypothetical protein n=1 Tax=uncultured Reyranella sp. TaxID=735512 RepID=UPI0025E4BF7A|nr:hypothetical protein [uncultured Reyranella sp.]
MFSQLLGWIGGVPPSVGSFIGTVTGSTLGLVALLLGALFNAHLNRKRDDRLRADEAQAARRAIAAELSGIVDTLARNADDLATPKGSFTVPDIAHQVRVFPALLPKVGLLGVDEARAAIDAYAMVDQYCEALLLKGGKLHDGRPDRRLVLMPKETAASVARHNRAVVEAIAPTIALMKAPSTTGVAEEKH